MRLAVDLGLALQPFILPVWSRCTTISASCSLRGAVETCIVSNLWPAGGMA